VSQKKKLTQSKISPPQQPTAVVNRFDKLEAFLSGKKQLLVLWLPLMWGAFFCFMLFDVKISEGGDDSMYIEAAWKYGQNLTGYFYTANAPLYPLFLGLVTKVSGLNLLVFKIINCIFFLVYIFLTYKAFATRIPLVVLLPVMLFISVNSWFLFYASQTYTEILFVAIQTLFLWVFFNFYDANVVLDKAQVVSVNKLSKNDQSFLKKLKSDFNLLKGHGSQIAKLTFYCGISLLLMTLCKNIAIGMLATIGLFCVIEKKYRELILIFSGYIASRVVWEILRFAVWGATNQYGSQSSILLQRDPYNPAAGNEDFAGFIARFIANNDLYTSRRLFQILGFTDPASLKMPPALWMLVFALLIFSAYRIFKEYRTNIQEAFQKIIAAPYLVFIFIYTIIQFALTYVILQASWDQPRVILIYIPLLLMIVFYGGFSYLKSLGNSGFVIYLFFVVLILGSSFISTTKKSIKNYPVLVKNLQGDKYYGYTPDWENFLRMSEYCADSLSADAVVASRKAPMSFVYGKGKEFFPVYTALYINPVTNMSYPDSAFNYFKENKVTHVILASIRQNPLRETSFIINTLQRMLEPIARQYPGRVKFVKKIGDREASYLYELDYSNTN
jgi:hypothetical protein